MPSIRHILATTLLLALLSPVLTQQPDQVAKDREAESDVEKFQKLIDQIDPPSLHAALHDFSPKKFKHGMFQEDRNAVKAIHMSEPKAAHSIIELAKRQDGISNGTTPTSSVAQASTPASGTSSVNVATPVPPISEGSTIVPASSASTSPASSGAAPTSSPASSTQGSITGSETASSTAATTSPPTSSSLTNGEVVTTTDASGHIIISTIGGGVRTITPSGASSSAAHSSITSTAILTSTLPNGSQSTITAVTVIQAGNGEASTPTGAAGVSGSKTGSTPGLQTGEAVMSRGFGREGMAVLVGALGFAAMM